MKDNDSNLLEEAYSNVHKINLWLDDERDPKDPITQQKFGAKGDECWVKTSSDCINILKTGGVLSVSLDHDLGDSVNGTGYDVSTWIEEAAYNNKIPKILTRVHSANPIGKEKMERALINANRYWNR